MYHISIYFDTKTEARMREYIRKVAESTGNTYMLEADVPPHITLAAFESDKENELIQGLTDLAAALPSETLKWVSVGTFLPGVIFLQPVLNEYLQEMMCQVHNCLKKIENVKIRPCYCPFSWIPHSTLAKKLTPDQLQQAFVSLQKEFVVFEGSVTRIGLAKMNPHREIASFILAKQNRLCNKWNRQNSLQ